MACAAVGVPRSTHYSRLRSRAPKSESVKSGRNTHSRRLSHEERAKVLAMLHSPRFIDKAPHTVYAALLDEGIYLCSPRTMYRILASCNEVRERRNQARHPAYPKPELLATAPNRVWSWDITKLKGAQKGELYYLYVILDIHSRYVVGWTLERSENAKTAKRLFRSTCKRHAISSQQLQVHSDRGAPMKAKTFAALLTQLGVDRSYSRPRVSNDNAFSESHFKTVKNQPKFPKRFGSFEDALSYCRRFFEWYNNEHYHSGIAYMTPYTVHHGKSDTVRAKRQSVLEKAFNATPQRFVHGLPRASAPPQETWINRPESELSQSTTPPLAVASLSATGAAVR